MERLRINDLKFWCTVQFYYTLITYLMVLSAVLLSMSMILLPSKLANMWSLNLNLTCEKLLTGVGRGFLFLMFKKLTFFWLILQVNLFLLMVLPLMKSYVLRYFDFFFSKLYLRISRISHYLYGSSCLQEH